MLHVDNLKPKSEIKMSQYLTGKYYYLTDKGKIRNANEDFATAVINPFGNVLLLVADGMGGASKGEIASSSLGKYIVKSFLSLEEEFKNEKAMAKWVYKVVKEANQLIYQKSKSKEEYKGMGTTLSLALIMKDKLLTAQVGDSRVYLLIDKSLTQITTDQTYVNYLIRVKGMNKEIASTHPRRHELTNAVGTKERINVDIEVREYHHEKILVCSDGLYNNVPISDIESIIKGNDSLDKKANQLIAFGNFNGGSDNMALVLWESDD